MAPDDIPRADLRKRFARRAQDADPAAERAFAESKLEMIRTHPTLSDEERQAAIAELEEKLRGPATDS